MSYTALYRKWRPQVFEDVKGQDHIVTTLRNQVITGRIGHAYLFCGTRGTGKTTVAKIFARAVNCEHPVNGSPCGKCASCRDILDGSSMNVEEIDAASNNGVENIRDIRERIQYPPTMGKYRVFIIDEAHMLSAGAFNALLKTLEEPPSYVIFILATTEPNRLPVTVLSRCQRYDFKRINVDTIAARLKELAAAEKIEIEDKAVRYIAKAADGSLRDALSLLDQCAAFHYGEPLTYDQVLDVLGAVDNSVFHELFNDIIAGNAKDCILKLEDIVDEGRDLTQFVSDFTWYLRNLLLAGTVDDMEDLFDMSADNLADLKEDAKLADENTLMRYIRVFSDLSGQIKFSGQKRVLIETALIKLTRPEMEENLDSVLERLDRLERRMDEGIPVKPEQVSADKVTEDVFEAPRSSEHSQTAPEKEADIPAETTAAPPERTDDPDLIRSEWGKIVNGIGGSVRPCLLGTVVEPSGDGCMCIVFDNAMNFEMGSRPTALHELEDYVAEKYGKKIRFQTRVRENTERLGKRYVSDEKLRSTVHMDITEED